MLRKALSLLWVSGWRLFTQALPLRPQIPMSAISTLDIEVPGDGKTIRGVFLDWMTSSEVVHPLNAEHRDIIPEPFSSLPPLHSPEQDLENFGTVTATLASETIQIGSDMQRGAVFQFTLHVNNPMSAGA